MQVLAHASDCSAVFKLLRAVLHSADQLTSSFLSPASASCPHPGLLQGGSCWGAQQQRCATKKAGGNAKQAVGSHPKHLGVKMTDGELAFPGMIIARQRGTRFHAGSNAGIGRDHTVFATSAGFVRFSRATTEFGKERRTISVEPINGDSSPAYKDVVADMVKRRAVIKRDMLDNTPFEPALHFQLPTRDGSLSWVGQDHRPSAALAAAPKVAPPAAASKKLPRAKQSKAQ
jgi:large subunit ribosomal protein L27